MTCPETDGQLAHILFFPTTRSRLNAASFCWLSFCGADPEPTEREDPIVLRTSFILRERTTVGHGRKDVLHSCSVQRDGVCVAGIMCKYM